MKMWHKERQNLNRIKLQWFHPDPHKRYSTSKYFQIQKNEQPFVFSVRTVYGKPSATDTQGFVFRFLRSLVFSS